jgi:uncharacterized protein (DUF1697 family)
MLYVAFLRGINVSGHRMIPMAALRDAVGALGFSGVETYIQTGNLLLESDLEPGSVQSRLSAGIADTFGHQVPVAVRTEEALRAAVARCPYRPEPETAVYVGFMVDDPGAGRREVLLAGGGPATGDAFQIVSREIYIHYRHGVHTSPLSNAFFERRLGVPVTSRNLRTVVRMERLLEARR